MNIVTTVKEWQEIRKSVSEKTFGFVPTMGHLHAGHMKLCQRSNMENDLTVVSIFVNPTQFNHATDLSAYPRTLRQDIHMLEAAGIDYLFLPQANEIYADHYQVQVIEKKLSVCLEGEFRPGHFEGMQTVVLKLLNIIQAQHAYFGEKDYQQYLLVKKMVESFFISTEIVACETVRAEDGLALSSRNTRLSEEQRKVAAGLPHFLQSSLTLAEITEQLISHGFRVDYVAEKWGRRLAAVWLGDVRLIDNISI